MGTGGGGRGGGLGLGDGGGGLHADSTVSPKLKWHIHVIWAMHSAVLIHERHVIAATICEPGSDKYRGGGGEGGGGRGGGGDLGSGGGGRGGGFGLGDGGLGLYAQ